MHSSVSLFSIMSYVHNDNPCVFYEVAIRLEVRVLLLHGSPTINQSETKSHISYCVTAKSHIMYIHYPWA